VTDLFHARLDARQLWAMSDMGEHAARIISGGSLFVSSNRRTRSYALTTLSVA
jgi:hypothetical protein